MAALFQITENLLRACDQLVDSDGEISPENAAALAELEAVADDKLGSYYWLIKKLDMEIAAVQAILDQRKKQLESRNNLKERLKAAVLAHMQATGQTKITVDGNTFAVQKNGGKRPVQYAEAEIDLSQIPDGYIKTVRSVDTDAVRRDLEAGEQLPFAALGEQGSHLRLR